MATRLFEGDARKPSYARVAGRTGEMTERRTTRRYDLSLPIIIRGPAHRALDPQQGKTRDISTRGLYFVVDQKMESGSQLDMTLTLPSEVTRGSDVFVRALGRVIRVERRKIGRASCRERV